MHCCGEKNSDINGPTSDINGYQANGRLNQHHLVKVLHTRWYCIEDWWRLHRAAKGNISSQLKCLKTNSCREPIVNMFWTIVRIFFPVDRYMIYIYCIDIIIYTLIYKIYGIRIPSRDIQPRVWKKFPFDSTGSPRMKAQETTPSPVVSWVAPSPVRQQALLLRLMGDGFECALFIYCITSEN